MKKQYILFDLDGTITNNQLGITKSVQYALNHLGVEVTNLDELKPFIGPPLLDAFKQLYGFDDNKAQLAVKIYREYYSQKGIYENTPYDGINNCLAAIQRQGVQIILATSKPEIFARKILERFELIQYFDNVVGADLDGAISAKTDVMRKAIEISGINNREQAVMIGDRMFDIDSSNEIGIESIAVLYGFGSLKELETSNPTYIVSTVEQLQQKVIDLII